MRLWTIRAAQLEVLGMKALEPRFAAHLRKFFPERCKALGRAGVLQAIQDGVARARAHGIVAEREVCKFVDLTFVFGRAFDAERSWARRILAQADRSPSERMEELFSTALSRVDRASPIQPRSSP